MRGRPPTPLADRLWSKVDTSAGPGGCWPFTGFKHQGYGRIWSGGEGGHNIRAHRAAYELLIGPIPDGLVLDHLCRNRACCNPSHLEPVPNRVNILRGYGPPAVNAAKVHCANGHPLVPRADGHRRCRECHREWDRRRWHRRAARNIRIGIEGQ